MPSTSPQTLRRLTYFAAIAEAGSINGAARRLNLSVPVISEALSELEAELHLTLATRTTRRFSLTEAGERVYQTAAEILSLAQGLQDTAHPDAPLTGRLALTLPVELASHWVAPHLAAFQARHPGVEFSIDASDQVATLKNSSFDLAIRTTYQHPGTVLKDKPLLPLTCVARDTPSQLRKDTEIRLQDTALIGPRPDRGLLARDPKTGQDLRLTTQTGLKVNNRTVALALAQQGLGVTLVLEHSAAPAIEAGQLTRVLPDCEFGSIALDIVFRDKLPSRTARAFASYLSDN